jgi:hypothetical protein
MKIMCTLLVSASRVTAAMVCITLLAPAYAAPPTVTPSPGYDARLQEERGAKTAYSVVQAPVQRNQRRAHHRAR